MVGRRSGPAQPATGSTPTCGSRPASSSRTSSPGFSGGPKMVAPGLAASRPRWSCTTRGASAIRGHLGHHRRQPGPRRRAGDRGGHRRRLRARRDAQRRAADHPRVRRRGPEMHAAACAARERGDAAGRRPVRCRRHDELRLPARPEPVPGGQGHVGRGRGRRGRAARSSAPPSAATGFRTTARTARLLAPRSTPAELLAMIAAAPRDPRPVAGPDPGADPASAPGSCSEPTASRRPRSGPPTWSGPTTSRPRWPP